MKLQVLHEYLMKPDSIFYLVHINTADSLRHCLSKDHFNISAVSIIFLIEAVYAFLITDS
jgi:hypothetical protein